MGKGSTQFQYLVQTEVPPKLLEDWLKLWAKENQISKNLRVQLRPHTAESELLELSIWDETETKKGNIVFATIQDRRDRHILSVRDQHTFDMNFRRKRFMTLLHLFLIHRYKIISVHYVTPTEDNLMQSEKMKDLGIFNEVHTEIGHIIVATVNTEHVKSLLNSDGSELERLIAKSETLVQN